MMFWLGLLVGILAYIVIVGILTFYTYNKKKKEQQKQFKNDNE